MNTLKLFIYRILARIYPYNVKSPFWARIMKGVQAIFGWAIVNVNGIKLRVRLASKHDRLALIGGANEQTLINLIDTYIKPDDVMLDIGANIGVYSVYASAKHGAFSFAFEPSPRELKRIYHHLILNNSNNVTVFPFGLSDKFETLQLQLSDEANPGENSVVGKGDQFIQSVSCHFARFDELIMKDMLIKARICKIDVEGYELHVLRGMKKTISDMQKCIFYIEMSPDQIGRAGETLEEIYKFFASHGFSHKYGLQNKEYDEIFYHPKYTTLKM